MGEQTHDLDPQLAAALTRSAELERSFVTARDGIAASRDRAIFVRSYWNRGGPEMAAVEERRVPGLTRDVPVILYRPKFATMRSPVFVFLHGGGFQLGNEWANDRQMREIAADWGGVVISVDYLHAPEHVFPSAVDETAHVLRWIHDAAPSWGLDPERIAFGGTSAGASIAFGAALALEKATWLKAAVAVVGAFDFDTGSASMQRYGEGVLFPARQMIEPMLAAYVPDKALRRDPRVALLRADASHFPPTFLAAAECDVFKDASIDMANRLQQAGRLHSLKIYSGMAHLFFGLSAEVDESMRCVRDVGRFLCERLPST